MPSLHQAGTLVQLPAEYQGPEDCQQPTWRHCVSPPKAMVHPACCLSQSVGCVCPHGGSPVAQQLHLQVAALGGQLHAEDGRARDLPLHLLEHHAHLLITQHLHSRLAGWGGAVLQGRWMFRVLVGWCAPCRAVHGIRVGSVWGPCSPLQMTIQYSSPSPPPPAPRQAPCRMPLSQAGSNGCLG